LKQTQKYGDDPGRVLLRRVTYENAEGNAHPPVPVPPIMSKHSQGNGGADNPSFFCITPMSFSKIMSEE
jgi:hypothetical protein